MKTSVPEWTKNIYWIEARCADGSVQGTPAEGCTEQEAIEDGFAALRREGHDPQEYESITLEESGWFAMDEATARGI